MLLLRRPHFPRDNCQRRRRAAGRGLDLIRIGSRSRVGLSPPPGTSRFRWSTSPSLLQEPLRTPQTVGGYRGPRPVAPRPAGGARCLPSGAGSAIRLSRRASTLCQNPTNDLSSPSQSWALPPPSRFRPIGRAMRKARRAPTLGDVRQVRDRRSKGRYEHSRLHG